MNFRSENNPEPAHRLSPPRHRASLDLATRTRTPRRTVILIGTLVAMLVAVPAALAMTGGLKTGKISLRSMELVVNGDFENGTTGWKVNAPARQQIQAARPAANGAAAAALTSSTAGTVMLNDEVPTVASTTVGRTYNVSAYVRSSGPDLKGLLRIREVRGGAQIATARAVFRATGSSWSRIELAYTTTSNNAALDLNVVGLKVPAGVGLLVDSVSMVAMETISTPPSAPTSAPTSSSPSISPSSSPTSTPTKSPTSTPTSSPTSSPTSTPTSTPTSSPTSTPSAPPPSKGCVSNAMGIPATGTYLGAVVNGVSTIEQRETQLGGTMALHRSYFSADRIAGAVKQANADLAAGRLPWISFKEPLSWSQMASGAGDAWATQLADALATVNGPVWLAVHHEPENDGDMALWTKMQARIAPIIHARTNNVAYSVIYSGWNTFGGDTNTVATKWPGDANVDILAIDAYNDFGAVRNGKEGTKVLELKTYYAKMAAWSKAHGTRFAIGETGQTAKASALDPTWLDRTYHDMIAAGGIGLSYYDSNANSVADWSLNDKVKFGRFKALMPESPHIC